MICNNAVDSTSKKIIYRQVSRMRDIKVQSIRVIDRLISVLNCFSNEYPTLYIENIVEKTKLPKATVYRILWSLEQNGFIQYDDKENNYSLGHKFLEFGEIVKENQDVLKEAGAILSKVHIELGFPILMAVRQKESIQFLLAFENPDGIQSGSYVGRKRALNIGALGIALMAYLPLEECKKILNQLPLEKRTPYTLVDEDQFLERLDTIRQKGYFVEKDEVNVGFSGIGVPVFNRNQEIIAVIGTFGSNFDMNPKVNKKIIKTLKDTADQLSKRVGHLISLQGDLTFF